MGGLKKNEEELEIQHEIMKAEKMDKRFDKIKSYTKKIEKKYDTKVVFLLGEFTDYMYDMFIRQLRKVEKVRRRDDWITIVLHSTGGDADVAFKIMDVMRKHKCKFCVVAPINAGSAGAEVAMNADKLVLGRYSYLTPFDTQLGSVSLKNISDFDLERCVRVKDYNRVKEAKNYEQVARDELLKMFEHRYSSETVLKLEALFIHHTTSHDHPVSVEDIQAAGVTHVKQTKVKKWFHKIVGYYIDGELDDSFRFEFYQSRV